MPKITKTYNINSIQQLIDLNQDSKNFKLTFECKSHNVNDKYEILVLNQSQLDTEDANNLPLKQVSQVLFLVILKLIKIFIKIILWQLDQIKIVKLI